MRVLGAVLLGCNPSRTGGDPRPYREAVATRARRASPRARPLVHDFGTVVSRGQEFRHAFVLRNDSARPVRVLSATASMPCCSAVAKPPQFIPPAGSAEINVVFRPGSRTGRQALRFKVVTDSDDQPAQSYVLRANLLPEWEISPVGDRDYLIRLGRPNQDRWRVVCRRVAGHGLPAPDAVTAREPATAEFLTPGSEEHQPDNVIVATRDVGVRLPAMRHAGPFQCDLTFRWPDGFHQGPFHSLGTHTAR